MRIILRVKFAITVDMGTTMTFKDKMNAIIEIVCHHGAPRLVAFENERDGTVGNGYETDDTIVPLTDVGSDTDHYGESDDEHN